METLLLIDDLPQSCSAQQLEAQLRHFGSVEHAEIVRNGEAPPFGRVTMATYEAAQAAQAVLAAQGYQVVLAERGAGDRSV
jgi:hypothetical protein